MTMSDNQREQEAALNEFQMMGPDTANLVKGPIIIDIQSMIGMSRQDNSLKPTVMFTVTLEDRTFSIPIPPHLSIDLGVQLIEAANAAQTDVLSLQYDAERGVPTRESIDRLHTIAAKRAEERPPLAYVKESHA
jgi:hypothetical protein